MTMGFPEKTNDALIGSEQLVYGATYVYLQDKRVVEVQTHAE